MYAKPTAGPMRKLLHVVARLGLSLRPGVDNGFNTELRPFKQHVITIYVPLRRILQQLPMPMSLEGQLCSDIAHELGHYLIAPPGRRHRKDYGISHYRGRSDAAQRRWDLDEAKAVFVAHWLLAQLGFGKEAGVQKSSVERSVVAVSQTNEVIYWWRTKGREQVIKTLREKGVMPDGKDFRSEAVRTVAHVHSRRESSE